jgi:hypothetical protein
MPIKRICATQSWSERELASYCRRDPAVNTSPWLDMRSASVLHMCAGSYVNVVFCCRTKLTTTRMEIRSRRRDKPLWNSKHQIFVLLYLLLTRSFPYSPRIPLLRFSFYHSSSSFPTPPTSFPSSPSLFLSHFFLALSSSSSCLLPFYRLPCTLHINFLLNFLFSFLFILRFPVPSLSRSYSRFIANKHHNLSQDTL